ncbi:LOW QUALITY PROTEIN: regulator of G-protein signaling 3-like [Lagopus leucura]|uniref:LOW QUALITY PROTEIN: regulator of G-protein signaling 3-like n=1 Tax=Lagopus leucura TaxID=30410 RepID=UPI001C677251|nr:LOW QUALITY PROTEIN: regulator of G-protein signaling 3-like [Lagopus leucura]
MVKCYRARAAESQCVRRTWMLGHCWSKGQSCARAMEQRGESGLACTRHSPGMWGLPEVQRRAERACWRSQGAVLGRKRKISPAWVKEKGQLKLSIEVQDRSLMLHVVEAKGLMGTEYRPCDSYVKMSIVPDADGKCRQKTKTVPDSKNPVFHEHFVFLVQEEDEQKRLLVTVWNRERDCRQSKLIGCMSFGVKSLLTLDKVPSSGALCAGLG